MTKEQKLLQAIDNLEAAVETLVEEDNVRAAVLQEYRDRLMAAKTELATLRQKKKRRPR